MSRRRKTGSRHQGFRLPDSDSGVHDPAPLARSQRHDRIQIELGDLGNGVGQAGEAQEQIAQCVEVGRRVSPISLQQRKSFDPMEKLVYVPIRQRRNSHEDVFENLHVDAAQTKRHQRTEHRILHDARS